MKIVGAGFAYGFAGFILGLMPCRAGITDEFRLFTNQSGQAIEARLLAYDTDRGTVTLERRNGKSGSVPADTLSPEDHAYLEQWLVAQQFLGNDLLEIQVNFIEGSWQDAGDARGNRKRRDDRIEILMTNHGSTTLTNISAEYCEYRDRRDYISAHNKSVEIEDLIPGRHFETTRRTTGFRDGGSFLNATVGARFRFRMTLPDGTPLVREICTPYPFPIEEYPWVESEREREALKASMPDPAHYPEIAMSEEEVRALADRYIAVWENEDYETWASLLSPMYPADKRLDKSNFMSHLSRIKFMKIETIEGRDVKVKVYYKSGRDPEAWLQITPSGHIKYTPLSFQHPLETALRMLYALVNDEYSMTNTGTHALDAANIPSFSYNHNGSIDSKVETAQKILEWIRENGATHDASEPKVHLPNGVLRQALEAAEQSISYAQRRLR